jgi:hypothetical protein
VCRLGCAGASLSSADRISKGNRSMNMLRRKRMSRWTSFRCISMTEKHWQKDYAAAPLSCATIIGDPNIRATKASLFILLLYSCTTPLCNFANHLLGPCPFILSLLIYNNSNNNDDCKVIKPEKDIFISLMQ